MYFEHRVDQLQLYVSLEDPDGFCRALEEELAA